MVDIRCDVAVIGCGPTGVVLANLLGCRGVRVAVLERDTDVYPFPRATHIDEETLRNFQATGLIDELLPYTSPFGTIEVVDERGRVLVSDVVEDPNSPHGYRGSRFFDQPMFERILRRGLERYPTVSLHVGMTVERVVEADDKVSVACRNAQDGGPLVVHADWAIGCDGGRSVTRASARIGMNAIARRRPWLIVDAVLRDASDAARLPKCFTYYFKRERLMIYAHGFGANRRWEFQLGTDEPVPPREVVLGWISRFIEPDRMDITRIVPYEHSALVAKPWRSGRVLVAGDAAHMMPPSAGQGMCSGVRDAVNLAWKLSSVVAGASSAGLLDTYERERAPHVREVLEGTLSIGSRLRADNAFQRWRRRNQLRFVMAVPRLKERARRKSLRRPALVDGFRDARSPDAGTHFPQFMVRRGGVVMRLDDAIGYRSALIVERGACSAADADWATQRGIELVRLGLDVDDVGGRMTAWMVERGVEFALVRPDRFIFSTGRVGEIARARRAFDVWTIEGNV